LIKHSDWFFQSDSNRHQIATTTEEIGNQQRVSVKCRVQVGRWVKCGTRSARALYPPSNLHPALYRQPSTNRSDVSSAVCIFFKVEYCFLPGSVLSN
jgi:hypothetical protein